MSAKRWRTPSAKSGELNVVYGKEPHDNPDILYCWCGESQMGRDSRMSSSFFENMKGFDDMNLRQELERRG